MIEFSLKIDTPPFIPNMEEISKYSIGDFGIGKNIIEKQSEKLLKTFNLNDVEKKRFLDNIKENDGIISIEKTIFKTIFETNQPVIKALNTIPKLLSKFEITCAQSLGIIDKSLNPYHNTNSLTYDLYKPINIENLKKANTLNDVNVIKNDDISTDVFLKENSINISNDSGKWATVSEYYSTGIKYDNIKYSTEYILLNNNKPNNKEVSDITELNVNKPPTIIFGVYDCFGNDSYINLPDFISNSPKFYKNLGIKNVNNNKNSCDRVMNIDDYKKSIKNKIIVDLKNQNKYTENNLKDILEITNNIIDVDLYNNVSNNAFMKNVFSLNSTEYATYNSTIESNNEAILKILDGGKMYQSFEIEYNGKSVCIDPENEYYLQILRFKVDTETNLNTLNTPYTNYYQHNLFKDTLDSSDYDLTGITKNHNINTTGRVLELNSTFKNDAFTSTDLSNNNNTILTNVDGTYFYVVEGILKKDILKNNFENKTKNDKNKYFNKQHFGLAIVSLIDTLIYFGIAVLPDIKKLLNYLKNPTKAIINILTDILSKTFKMFDVKLLKKFLTLSLKKTLKEKIEYINKHLDLKKFAYIDKDGTPIFTGDGSHFVNFLNIEFGFGLKNGKLDLTKSTKNNSLIKLLLNTVTIPLKLIKDLVETLIKQIKEINIKNIKSKLEEIISFKIITDQFKIENIIKIIGLDINKELYKEIKNGKTPNNSNDKKDFNFIKIPLLNIMEKINTYESDIINNKFGNKYLDSIINFFKFFDSIFRKIMDFIYDIINLSPKLRNYISFTSFIQDILKTNDNKTNTSENTTTYYNVKFDDGRTFENITLVELEEIKNTYKNVKYIYL
jgi:hypothetical protein